MSTILTLTQNLQSVHDLLYRIAASELGLASVAHPVAELTALQDAHPHLKQICLAGPGGSVTVPVFGPLGALTVELDRKSDNLLFIDLYKNLAYQLVQAFREGEAAQSRLVTGFVLPLAGRALFESLALKNAVIVQLKAHHAKHGGAVQERNLRTLKHTFRVHAEVLAELQA